MIYYRETEFGFKYGSAEITRAFSDEKRGWATFMLETPKYKGHKALQIYVTKTGKVRVLEPGGKEWKPCKEE